MSEKYMEIQKFPENNIKNLFIYKCLFYVRSIFLNAIITINMFRYHATKQIEI